MNNICGRKKSQIVIKYEYKKQIKRSKNALSQITFLGHQAGKY